MRPDPIVRIDSAFFWDACDREELMVQKCPNCEILWHPPRPMCPKCHTTEKDYEKLSGKGKILSWGQQVTPPAYGFEESPIAVLVELDEGVRIVSTLEGIALDDITPEMPVTVEFADTSGGRKIHVFRPVQES